MTDEKLPNGLGYPDIPQRQKKYFDTSEAYTEHTLDEVRKMPIWAAGEWHGFYVLYVATDCGTEIDEDGFLPEGMRCIFIDKNTGKMKVTDAHGAVYFIPKLRSRDLPIGPLPEVPFDNLKIG